MRGIKVYLVGYRKPKNRLFAVQNSIRGGVGVQLLVRLHPISRVTHPIFNVEEVEGIILVGNLWVQSSSSGDTAF